MHIYGDSRLRGLGPILDEFITDANIGIQFKAQVHCIPGATIARIANTVCQDMHGRTVDFLFIAAGINDLSIKHPTGLVQPRYTDVPVLVEVLCDKFITLRQQVSQHTRNTVICQLVGADFDAYNASRGIFTDFNLQLTVINEAVPILNNTITCLNRERNLVSPWLQGSVHCFENKRMIHKYARLADGLHPTDITKRIWAKAFAKAIKTNLNWK